MTYLVAFDGSPHATAALRRARRLAEQTGAHLVVGSVLPTDADLASRYGFRDGDGDGGGDGDDYDVEAATRRLRAAAREVAPTAEFRARTLDAYAGKGQIAAAIRALAVEEAATLVFVGSDRVGRVADGVTSVEGRVAGLDEVAVDDAEDPAFDVVVVRTR